MATIGILIVLAILGGIEGAKRDNELNLIDELRTESVNKIKDLWHDISQPEWHFLAKQRGGADVELKNEFINICDHLDEIGATIANKKIEESVLPPGSWQIISKESHNILQTYWNIRDLHQASHLTINLHEEWKKLAEKVLFDTAPSTNIPSSLENIQEMIADKLNTQKNLFESASKEIGSSLCTIEQSPQQLLFNLYATVQLTQLKAYTMIQFSWMLLRIYNKGNFTLESNMMKQKYLQRTFQQAIAAKKAMEGAKREYWRCDPRRHIEGKTYTELTKLNQGFIVNEVDLNDQKSCKEDCPNYKMTKQYGCYKDNYCVEQPRCNGKIVNCQYIDSDMWVCPSDVSSKRRYDWVEYENGHTLGLKRSCSRKITKVDSWWRWLFWHCSFCFCHCDDPNDVKSDRYFNLRSVTSKTSENKVITGLRFVKSDRVIHLQIQEGTMLPKGEINESSVAWRPVDSYNVKDAKEGKDYHIINYEQRAIDLDDLLVPEEHVLTGVRFRKVGKHLNFEIQATKFNYETGNLRGPGDRSQWISNDNTDGAPEKPRTRLHLERPDIPTRSPALAVPDSKSDQYLEFTSTDIDSDAAQNTVPFIDIMEVAPKPPVPLAGAGIYHKGQRWYGGFIAPKVFTYDFTNHIDINKLRKDMNTK